MRTTLVTLTILAGCAAEPAPPAAGLNLDHATVVAEARAASTTISFVRLDGATTDAVDVVIHGKSGDPDYGSLIAESLVTPLELFHMLEPAAQIPDALVRDQALRPTHSASSETQTSGLSTFSCLSFDNFTAHLDSLWVGSTNRHQASVSSSTWPALDSPTSGEGWWHTGKDADLYVCNYNSEGSTDDTMDAWIDGARQSDDPSFAFSHLLHDGEYFRVLFSNAGEPRFYTALADPVSALHLTAYLGWVVRD